LVSTQLLGKEEVRETNKGVDETRAAAQKELSIHEVVFLLQCRI
jgi:hypothetical protein